MRTSGALAFSHKALVFFERCGQARANYVPWQAVNETKPETSGVPAATVLALVETLYAFAENPVNWVEMTSAMEALPHPLDPTVDAEARAVLTHASRASAIVDRLNAGRQQRSGEANHWDGLLLTAEGLVRGQCGQVAERLHPFLLKPISEGQALQFHRGAAELYQAAFERARTPSEPHVVPFTLSTPEETSRCFGALIPREAFPSALATEFGLAPVWAEPLYSLVLFSTKEVSAAGTILNRNFGLTSVESRLSAKLLQGMTISDAARDLGIQVSTARWHIKNIYTKTGTQRQTDLLRLLTNASTLPERSSSAGALPLEEAPSRRFVRLADGRRLFYREYGRANGLPVIYFHFGLSSSLLPPAAARAMGRCNVRVISFDRPGYGQSDPRKDYRFETIAEDVDELRQQLRLRRVSLFGDGYGGGFAVAAAHRLGAKLERLALHAPNLGRAANEGQSAGGLSAFFRQPWLIPPAAELLRRGLRIGVVRSLMALVGEKSNLDAKRINDPAFDRYLSAAVFDALEKTSAGLAAELAMFSGNARADPSGLLCPIGVWQGKENSVITPHITEQNFKDLPGARVNLFPDAGLFLNEPEFFDIFAWLAEPPCNQQ